LVAEGSVLFLWAGNDKWEEVAARTIPDVIPSRLPKRLYQNTYLTLRIVPDHPTTRGGNNLYKCLSGWAREVNAIRLNVSKTERRVKRTENFCLADNSFRSSGGVDDARVVFQCGVLSENRAFFRKTVSAVFKNTDIRPSPRRKSR
jgi:hypothetical protein